MNDNQSFYPVIRHNMGLDVRKLDFVTCKQKSADQLAHVCSLISPL